MTPRPWTLDRWSLPTRARLRGGGTGPSLVRGGRSRRRPWPSGGHSQPRPGVVLRGCWLLGFLLETALRSASHPERKGELLQTSFPRTSRAEPSGFSTRSSRLAPWGVLLWTDWSSLTEGEGWSPGHGPNSAPRPCARGCQVQSPWVLVSAWGCQVQRTQGVGAMGGSIQGLCHVPVCRPASTCALPPTCRPPSHLAPCLPPAALPPTCALPSHLAPCLPPERPAPPTCHPGFHLPPCLPTCFLPPAALASTCHSAFHLPPCLPPAALPSTCRPGFHRPLPSTCRPWLPPPCLPPASPCLPPAALPSTLPLCKVGGFLLLRASVPMSLKRKE